MATIPVSAKIERADNYLGTDLDGESIIMQVTSGTIYGIGDTAKAVWDLTQPPITFSTLIETLTQTYKIDQNTCRDDVEPFLQALKTAGLITIA